MMTAAGPEVFVFLKWGGSLLFRGPDGRVDSAVSRWLVSGCFNIPT